MPKPLEDVDRERLVEELPATTSPEKRDRTLVLLLLSTGARSSDVLRLNRSDWGHERVAVVGKGDKERVVNVTTRARDGVDDYLADRTDPSPALFINFQAASNANAKTMRASRLTDRGARYICTELSRRLSIPAFHPHRLRHTLGTVVQEELGDARLTADILGHVGLGSVAGYTQITEMGRKNAKDHIERAGL